MSGSYKSEISYDRLWDSMAISNGLRRKGSLEVDLQSR